MQIPEVLSPASKYNWWTPAHKKAGISQTQKIASIMSRGTLGEIVAVFRDFSSSDLEESFTHIQADRYALTPRRRGCLITLLEEKKSGKL